MTHLRKSREETGCPREARYLYRQDTLTLRVRRQWLCAPAAAKAGKISSSTSSSIRIDCSLQTQRGKCKPLATAKSGKVPEAAETKCSCCGPDLSGGRSHQPVSRHRLLPTPCWDPKQLGCS